MGLKDQLKTKNFISTIFYILIVLICANLFLKKFSFKKNNDKEFFIKLDKINYFKGNEDPYMLATKLEINPTNFFSLPINYKNRMNSKNNTFSLNKNNFRINPYNLLSSEKKKCIFITGSSTAFGVGVTKDSKTIPAQLNKILGDKYRVFNLAIPSWNSRQELITLIDSFNYHKDYNCSSFDTISFTGTADIKSIVFNSKSKYFKNKLSQNVLVNAPEQYNILEKRIEKLEKIESSIKYNFRIILNQINKKLFGEIYSFLERNIFTLIKKQKPTKVKLVNSEVNHFINMQAKAFIQNQILMNNITHDLGGNHFVFIQPDLKNYDISNQLWTYTNQIFSNYISQNNCLEIYDLRKYLVDKQKKYFYLGKNYPLSLKEAILKNKFRDNDMYQHFFYDDSHLTNNGSLKVSNLIATEITKGNAKKEKCDFE